MKPRILYFKPSIAKLEVASKEPLGMGYTHTGDQSSEFSPYDC